MRITGVPRTATGAPLPVWPPLLATRGRGGLSAGHAHHAMHLVLSLEAPLRVRVPLGEAAHASGFSDAAHMTRTFRRMLGMPPSVLRPPPAQPVRSRR